MRRKSQKDNWWPDYTRLTLDSGSPTPTDVCVVQGFLSRPSRSWRGPSSLQRAQQVGLHSVTEGDAPVQSRGPPILPQVVAHKTLSRGPRVGDRLTRRVFAEMNMELKTLGTAAEIKSWNHQFGTVGNGGNSHTNLWEFLWLRRRREQVTIEKLSQRSK